MDETNGVVQVCMSPCPFLLIMESAVTTALGTFVRLTDESQGEMGDLDLVLNPRLDILQIPLLDIDTQQELEELLG